MPAFLLVVLVFPSMQVLYIVEDVKSPSFTFKVVAHQWYWTYISSFFRSLAFSSDSVVTVNTPRVLSCRSRLYIPVNSVSRFLISSSDVIHSFSVPSMGLKVDALPGRINQIFSNPSRVGLFFGQCSEICGSNHSFMPISLNVVGFLDYEFSLGLNFSFYTDEYTS